MEPSFWTTWGTPAAISAAFGVLTYFLVGKREHRKWLRDKKVDTFTAFIKQTSELNTALNSINRLKLDKDDPATYDPIYAYMLIFNNFDLETPKLVFTPETADLTELMLDAYQDAANAALGDHANFKNGVWTGHAFGRDIPPEHRVPEDQAYDRVADFQRHLSSMRRKLARELGTPDYKRRSPMQLRKNGIVHWWRFIRRRDVPLAKKWQRTRGLFHRIPKEWTE